MPSVTFVAGVVTTIVAVVIVSNCGFLRRALTDGLPGLCKTWVDKLSRAPINIVENAGTNQEVEVWTSEAEKEQDDPATIPGPSKKPFTFRERQWHEPPELDYSGFESYDYIQREFKEKGGAHFEWKTNWLDLTAERHLLLGYLNWVKMHEGTTGDEWKFYYGLHDNILVDRDENLADLERNNQRFGMRRRDWRRLTRNVYEMRQNWKKSVGRV